MTDWHPRIAIVSDEAAEDFGDAVEVCLPLGIRAFELRRLPGGRVPYVDAGAVRNVTETVRRHGLQLIGISPGFFRGVFDASEAERELQRGFDDAFRFMDELAVRRMTVFSFRRSVHDAPIPPDVIEHLRRAAERCRQHGIEMLIENIAGHWGDTGEHLARLARASGAKLTWDPANAAASGERAFPDGYAHVREHVAHVHCKNWRPGKGDVALGDGVVDMTRQIAALHANGYAGHYCLEPHQWHDRAKATRTNAAQLLQMLEAAG